MKKAIALVLALVLCLGLMAGCSTGESTSQPAAGGSSEPASTGGTAGGDSKGVIYGIYKSGDQTWFLDEGAAAKEAATPDQTMSQAVVDKLSGAGIPVVAADDALEVNGEKLVPWVGINAYAIGQANGEWLANYAIENDLVGKEDVGLLIMTIDTVSSCVPRAEGEVDKFLELCPEWDESKIFYADNDGTTDKGNTQAAAVITAHPEIKTWLVTGANEECCIGAARALESAGLDKDACVVGLGAYMAKDEFKKEGGSCMKASTYFSSVDVGAGSIEVLLQLINGEEPPMETAVDAVVVTPENYVEVMGSYAE